MLCYVHVGIKCFYSDYSVVNILIVTFLPQLSLFTPDHRWHRAQVPSPLLQDRHLHPWDGCPRALCEEWPPLCFRSRATWSPTSSLRYQVTREANIGLSPPAANLFTDLPCNGNKQIRQFRQNIKGKFYFVRCWLNEWHKHMILNKHAVFEL